MKKILSVIILPVVGSSASYTSGIEGTCTPKMQGPSGDVELTLVFKITDGKLSGVVQTLESHFCKRHPCNSPLFQWC